MWQRAFVLLLLLSLAAPWGAAQVPELGGPDFARPISADKLPKSLQYKGEYLTGRVWREQGEPRLLVISEVRHEEALRNDHFISQYAYHKGKLGLMWSVKEFAKSLCQVNLYPRSLQILDLDNDGKYETSFMYYIECNTEEPLHVKLLLYRNGEKLALRGRMNSLLGPETELVMDSAVLQQAEVYASFLNQEWARFQVKSPFGELYIPGRGNSWFLQVRELPELQPTEYRLKNVDGSHWGEGPAGEWSQRFVQASRVEAAPFNGLLYFSPPHVGILYPDDASHTELLTLNGDNEGLSDPVWSSDSTQLAFVALNVDQYPEMTRVFVFEFGDGEVVSKREYDVTVEHTGFDGWEITPPEFVNDSTLRVKEVSWNQLSSGKDRLIELRNSADK